LSDDRFAPDSTVFNAPPKAKDWDGLTLEDALVGAVARKEVETIGALIAFLPEERREHYRQILRDLRGKPK
jgi:VIT1/CCC1 family predicted Fe2+/Mn2+ transporter